MTAATTERKHLAPLEWKSSGGAGQFSAIFATFDVVDHDGDVIRKSAFQTGDTTIIGSWGHKVNELPVGLATVRVGPTEASVDGRFFLDTEAGRETYQTVKGLGAACEWSWVFTVTRQSYGEHGGKRVRFIEGVSLISVDPVLRAAGIGTRTTAIKSADTMPADLETEFASGGWLLARAAISEAGQTMARVEKLTAKRYEVPSSRVPQPTRDAAAAAVRKSVDLLGITPRTIHWFAERGEPQLWGFVKDGATIALRSDLDPQQAYETAAHEMKHSAGGDEPASLAFGKVMVREALHRGLLG
ncbi:MAG: hypothetical protein IT303_10840 [Dehalococcoidia bacterium]|nr:hypothetical protein [Dehalococcoidia bacterium]